MSSTGKGVAAATPFPLWGTPEGSLGLCRAHLVQQAPHRADVADPGNVVKRDALRRQQGGGHRGQRGIHGATRRHSALDRIGALDDEFFHGSIAPP